MKRFCGAVFEERPSARSLFGALVSRVPPRPLVRRGNSERPLAGPRSRVERVRISGLAGAGASCWVREDRDLLEPTSCSFGWTGSRGPTPPRTGAGTPDVKWVKLFFQNCRGGVDLSPETSTSDFATCTRGPTPKCLLHRGYGSTHTSGSTLHSKGVVRTWKIDPCS